MKFFYLIFFSILLSSCATFQPSTTSRKVASVYTVIVTNNIQLHDDFKSGDTKFYRSCINHGKVYNCSSFFSLETHIAPFRRMVGMDKGYCTIDSANNSVVEAGKYSVEIQENVYEKNGDFDFKTFDFRMNQSRVTCIFRDENVQTQDLKKNLGNAITLE